MFDHLSIGVTDLDQSLTFYDAALKPLGISRMFAMGDRGDCRLRRFSTGFLLAVFQRCQSARAERTA